MNEGEQNNTNSVGQVVEPGATVQPAQDQPAPITADQPVAMPEAQESLYKQSSTIDTQPQQPQDAQNIQETQDGLSWTASEFIAHHKSSTWFVQFGIAAGLAITITYFLTRDVITTVVLAIAAVLFAIVANRKPRVMQYSITDSGISINGKFMPFGSFKSFSIIREGGVSSISFAPLQRFSPGMSIYYEPTQEDQIVSTLSQILPYEEKVQDPLDRLMSRIRF